ncbi:bactofilin family protein [Simiduia aestuariiviva]|uniref:Cytoskeletal protein CcmA (Bactofilin family) n=1 Tax=Simiduia aestuariiviva TaxID=1510459 RepID=A0A839UUS1_9GAMM|nr:polymer-forming cytoskeletal protein [Simiduia aestuariiviva]MBB3170179.1 cytoskeletal protein CcmA (bactofilin family) [Simiduia aestuariiviva]
MSLSGGTTLISKATKIVGDVHFSGSLEIEGEVEGNVIADGKGDAKVNVREKGRVKGDITAPLIMINGQVQGNVHSDKHIELASKAVVEGNVHYHMIEMVKGSQVNGSLVYGIQDKPKSEPSMAPKAIPGAAIVD